jgi:hypothetical protein
MTVSDDAEALALKGWDVLAVGRRQAWLFVTFGSPSADCDERTIWIDTDFVLTDPSGEVNGSQNALVSAPLGALEPLVLRIVEDVAAEAERLALRFDDGSVLSISNVPNARDSQGWWLG